jgi:amidohydrolase
MIIMSVIKSMIQTEVENIKDSLITVSDKIHDNPELGYEEYKAVEILTGELDKHGFIIEKGLIGIPTAFKATFDGKESGPVIAFLAEYDALPGIGHACGHNMIGTMSVGAAIALSKVMKDIPGKIVVFGTPAEETSGAKVTLVNEGVFDNVDVAMMIHPKDSNSIIESNLAIDAIEFAYKGKVAQAAIAPWDGINALDGVIQLFVAVNALRLRLRPEIRVHGIITKGGLAANIIPDEAVARFYIRGPKRKELDAVVKTIIECAEGAAKSTQTSVSISNYEFSFENMVPNVTMAHAFRDNLIELGVQDINEEPITSFGSSDMGNVSHIIPAIHPYLAIAPKGTITHSIEFAEATASKRAHEVLIIGAKALAMTGYDILTNKQLYYRIKEEFKG